MRSYWPIPRTCLHRSSALKPVRERTSWGPHYENKGTKCDSSPPSSSNPTAKSNKNDFIDAESIAEAVTKENMRFVQIKTQEQLDVQAMHRVRDRLVQRRTALINEIRGFLLERGITFAAQPIYLRKNLPTVIEDAEQNLSPRLRWLLQRMWQEWKQVEIDIKAMTDEIERISNENALCRRLRQIPGFGPLVSTATVAAIGNGAAFRRGRDFAAWVGVVPRQYSTGGKQKLFGISKRGNVYLRRMLIPRCPRGTASRQVRHRRVRAVGAPAGPACSAQQSCCRNRQQTSSHRLGRAVQWQGLSTPAAADHRSLMLAVEKTLRLESTKRFPLSHRHDDED